jgi:lipoprotein-releasing system permease protein
MSLLTLLTKRYAFSKRKSGFVSLIAWFSMAGIMLGVATLILVTSLMNGIAEEMLSNFVGVDGHIEIYSARGAIADKDALMHELQPLLPKGAILSARVQGQVMVTGAGSGVRGAQVVGLTPEDMQRKLASRDALVEVNQTSFAAGEGIIAGARLAEAVGADAEHPLTLISPQGQATAFGSVPRIKAYPLAGTFTLGMHALDNSVIFMPYEKALIYFGLSRAGSAPASSLEITLPDMEQAERIAVQLAKHLGTAYRVYPWQQTHQSVFTALAVQRNVMVTILTLIIVVAAFNIISSLVMLVKDKQSDIAILRTMGMSKRDIIKLFVMVGMSVGIIGTALGAVLGVIAALNIESIKRGIEGLTGQEILVEEVYFLSTLPTKLDAGEIIMIIASSLLISLLATLYPAMKAASLNPAEALHG